MPLRRFLLSSLLLAVAASGCAAKRPLLTYPEKDDDSEFCIRPAAPPTGLAAVATTPTRGPTVGRAGWRAAP